ncbi:glycosyl transferase [Aspergillus costaricaensis CBS 115574]|uniref:Glycosyl transferase n=1 Tax=Aspergillus costaricaensis CBS 115574 TaxID=1448317 RepID=A0ACD1IB00_9EURO|nr:glycosyl transferase [Aspergillus costaricaensis CBS 115574]RAK87175.1 glycosyl transferase [Aspergillus costaricaensis CBS 115574]
MLSKLLYNIQELPPDHRVIAGQRHRRLLYYVAHLASWTFNFYLVLRLALCFSAVQQDWRVWLTLLVEIVLASIWRHDQLLTMLGGSASDGQPRKRLRLHGTDDLPRVDILVPCCGEPVDVILDTVRAACTMDYPTSSFRVRVLDDGASTELESAIASLRTEWPHLFYHTRGRQSGKVFAKAGNMNYALFTLQEKAPPEFCAIFDADSIPMPHFLRATLPHLLQTRDAVLLTTRQYFYNLPSGDPLSQSRLHFYTCENAELDRRGLAQDAGSGALFRRQAIIDAGGYPTYSFSEDWQLSLVLKGLGHRTIQVQEPLQYGLVPTSLDGHIAQRNRWHIGHSQQLRALMPRTNKTLPRKLQWTIAWNGVFIMAGAVGCLITFAMVPLLLVSGHLVPDVSPLLAKAQFFLAVLHIAMTWAYVLLQSAHTGFESFPFSRFENIWLAGAHIHAVARFHLLASRPKGSFVTGSSANSWNRSATPTSLQKLYHNLWHNGIAYSVVILLATIASIVYSIYSAITSTDVGLLSRLLTTIAWPPMLHICYLSIASYWAPVSYLLSPPRYPERKAGLALSETGVVLPSAEVQQAAMVRGEAPVGFYRQCVLVVLVLGGLLLGGLAL